MLKSQQEIKRQKLRKEEVTSGFQRLKLNGGGPITFHNVSEIVDKKGRTKKISTFKRVITIQEQALHNRSLAEFVLLLRSMQSDFQADYFTF